MGVWRDVARRFAFVEYDGPPLEPLELYTKKSGDEIVGQLYNFTDKGGREVSLRPEMTPTLARMAAAKANALRKPVRWFSIPQLFRYERQQRGRLREHFQLNVDIIGEADVTADAELLGVGDRDDARLRPDVERRPRARVRIVGCCDAILASLGVGDEQAPAVFGVVDKLERQPRDVSRGKLAEQGMSVESIDALLSLMGDVTLDEIQSRFGSADGDDACQRPAALLRLSRRARRPRLGDDRSEDRPRSRVLHRHRVRAVRRQGRASRNLRRRSVRHAAAIARRRRSPGARFWDGRRRAGRIAPRSSAYCRRSRTARRSGWHQRALIGSAMPAARRRHCAAAG